jgi:hypothetical protein
MLFCFVLLLFLFFYLISVLAFLIIFLKSDFGRYFPEALSAKVQPIFTDVSSSLAASPASFYASSEFSLPWDIVFKELGVFCGLIPYLG